MNAHSSSVFQNEGQSSGATRHRTRRPGAEEGRERRSGKGLGGAADVQGVEGSPPPPLPGQEAPQGPPDTLREHRDPLGADSWQVLPLPTPQAASVRGSRPQLSAAKAASVPRPNSVCISPPRRIISGRNMKGELQEDSA